MSTHNRWGEEETKKLGGEKKKKMTPEAEQPRWSGGWRRNEALCGFICLFACMCLRLCWPMLASAKFMGLLTAIIPIHRLINRRQISFVTLLILIRIEHVLCKEKLFKHANLCFCFLGVKGGGIAGRSWGRGCLKCCEEESKTTKRPKNKYHKGRIPLPVSDVIDFFLFQSFPVRFLPWTWSPDTWYEHIIQATSGVFQKQRETAAICFETGGKLKCLVKVISRCQWFRNGLWNVNKGEGKKKKEGNIT